jgi:hypothetical protein
LNSKGLKRREGLISEISKLQRHGKLVCAHGGDDGLQFVAAFAGDADFIALDLGGHLVLSVPDEAGDLFGDGLFDALLDFDGLARVAKGGDVRVALLDAFEADASPCQFAHDDFGQGADFELVLSAEFDLVFFKRDLGMTSFEIEPVGQFLFGLVHRVFDFHRVDLRNDIE